MTCLPSLQYVVWCYILAVMTAFSSRYSSRPYLPPSRPSPESLTPPTLCKQDQHRSNGNNTQVWTYGTGASEMIAVLIATIPVRNCSDVRCARPRSLVMI